MLLFLLVFLVYINRFYTYSLNNDASYISLSKCSSSYVNLTEVTVSNYNQFQCAISNNIPMIYINSTIDITSQFNIHNKKNMTIQGLKNPLTKAPPSLLTITTRVFNITYSTVKLDNIILIGNNNGKNIQSGGLIYAQDSNLLLNNVTLKNGYTSINGGAVYAESSNVTIISTLFYNNTALTSNSVSTDTTLLYGGGAILITNSSYFRSINNRYILNSGLIGGALFLSSINEVSILNSLFNYNKAMYGYAGAVYVESVFVFSLSNSQFNYNTALYFGGAISLHNITQTVIISYSSFSNNVIDSTEGSGGGVYISNCIATLSHSSILSNTAQIGGGIFAQYSTLYINESTINLNTALISAGALACINNCTSIITKTNINSNVAHLSGGSIDIGSYSLLNIFNSTISNSKCTTEDCYGGAISCSGATVNLVSIVITGSQAYTASHMSFTNCIATVADSYINNGRSDTSYGVVATAGTSIQFSSTTFSYNLASLTGSVLGCVGTIKCSITSCIIDSNESGNSGQIIISGAHAAVTNSNCMNNIAYSGAVFAVTNAGLLTISNSIFTSNIATNNGGVAFLELATLYIINSNFIDNEATIGGCISVTVGFVNIVGSNFTGNSAYQEGGVIALDDESELTINSTTIKQSYSPFGGVISGQGDIKITLNYVTADYNTSPYGGGVIALFYNILLRLYHCKFNYNSATIGGVILGQYDINVEAIDCVFNNNYATDFGGAIFLQVRTLLSTTQSIFHHNTASFQGGAIAINSGLANFSFSYFEGNSGQEGACIYLINAPQIDIDHCKFISNGNTKVISGGAISLNSYSIVRSYNSTYVNNTALSGGSYFLSKSSLVSSNDSAHNNQGYKGAFIYSSLKSNVTFYNLHAHQNYAMLSYGSVIYVEDGYFSIYSSVFKDNIGPFGAISLSRVYTIISDCIFLNNHADRSGSSIFLYSISSLQDLDTLSTGFYAIVTNCLFNNNSAELTGGSITVDNYLGNVVLNNNTYVDNKSGYGGAISTIETNTTISNSKFINNSAVQGGGAIFWNYNSVTKQVVPIINCLDINNTAGYGYYLATNVVYLKWHSNLPYIISGSLLSDPIFIYLLDYYGQLVTNTTNSFSSSPFAFATLSNYSFILRGTTVVECNFGLAEFSQLIVSGTPGNNLTLNFQLSDSAVVSTSATFKIKSCIPGQINQFESPGVSICQNCTLGTYSLQISDTSCQLCPSNSYCPGLNVINVNPGYWRLSQDTSYVYQCPYSSSCLGGTNTSTQCLLGHTGPFCNVCDYGYAKTSSGECVQCSTSLYLETIILSPVLGAIAVMTFISVYVFRKKIKEMLTYIILLTSQANGIKFRSLRVKFKILISFYQIVSSIGPSFGIVYSPSYSKFLNVLSFINLNFFDISGLQCLFTPTFYEQVIFYTLFPILFFLLIAIILCTRAFISKRLNERNPSYTYQKAKDQLIGTALYISYIALIPVSTKLFELYGCTSLPNGENFLLADYSVGCKTSEYQQMIIYGAFMLIIYTIGIPLTYTILLVWNHKKVNPDWRLVIEGTEKKFINEKVIQRGKLKVRRTYKEIKNISFLFDNYKPKRWYFEIWDCIRRLTLG